MPGRTAPPAGRRRCRRSAPRSRRAVATRAAAVRATTARSRAAPRAECAAVATWCRPSRRSRDSSSSVRLALVASVTWRRAAGQLPDEPAVDRAEREFAALRARRARPATLSSNQAELRAGEIRIQQQARAPRDLRFEAVRLQRARTASAVRRSCQTMAGAIGRPLAAIPEHGRFALVGDADRGDVGRRRARTWPAPRRWSRPALPRSPRRRAPPSPTAGNVA